MSNIAMQAIQAHDYGDPEVLVLRQVPRPDPNRDQVLSCLKAAGETGSYAVQLAKWQVWLTALI